MADVLVLGGGILGLTTSILLARDGHNVTVLERDADELPAHPVDAWESWDRGGVAQFRQPHNLMPGFRMLLIDDMPDLVESVRDAGGAKFDMLNPLPPLFDDQSPREGDDRFWTYTARRPVAEWAFSKKAEAEPNIDIRRGVHAVGLLTGASPVAGIPHAIGVRTSDGAQLHADVVVDASGRRSALPDWIEAAGGRRPYQEEADCNFTYYTRYYQGDSIPQRIVGGLTNFDSYSVLSLPGDNNVWSLTIFTWSGDRPLKVLRNADVFTRLIEALPFHTHFLDGEPITDVLAMSGIADRYRRFVVDGSPVATGVYAVADAWSCTNPSLGRGMTVGLRHALELRQALRDHIDDPHVAALALDEAAEARVSPWVWAQIHADRARWAQIQAVCAGQRPPAPEGPAADVAMFFSVMAFDPDLFRHGMDYVSCLSPIDEVLARPGVLDRAREIAANVEPLGSPGPDRAQLLELVSA